MTAPKEEQCAGQNQKTFTYKPLQGFTAKQRPDMTMTVVVRDDFRREHFVEWLAFQREIGFQSIWLSPEKPAPDILVSSPGELLSSLPLQCP